LKKERSTLTELPVYVKRFEQIGYTKGNEYGSAPVQKLIGSRLIYQVQRDLGFIHGAVRVMQVSTMPNSPINRTKKTEEEKSVHDSVHRTDIIRKPSSMIVKNAALLPEFGVMIMYDARMRTLKREYDDFYNMEDATLVNTKPSTMETLRTAFALVMKQQRLNRDFLKVSRETEERLSAGRPSTILLYGL
jgi:hypothetical protein